MAIEDSRAEVNQNVINGCFKLPRISMPKDVEEDDDGCLSFNIAAHRGMIKSYPKDGNEEFGSAAVISLP
ncbi:hypothetical protein [Nitrosomonas sp. Nm166]|uniref:hypothetical protein n=1 Tax=Nitrosomonas sp. Nm166 TaxID=1881054 RepID=UPI0008EE25CF|nr:hypothetical protein [Nitrosomonas sp. Nm166]SFF04532.1 hypothetical protein SAMN05428977_10454 [Nitrosomonas sp. Nm166]